MPIGASKYSDDAALTAVCRGFCVAQSRFQKSRIGNFYGSIILIGSKKAMLLQDVWAIYTKPSRHFRYIADAFFHHFGYISCSVVYPSSTCVILFAHRRASGRSCSSQLPHSMCVAPGMSPSNAAVNSIAACIRRIASAC